MTSSDTPATRPDMTGAAAGVMAMGDPGPGTSMQEFRRYWPLLLVATFGCTFGVSSMYFYSSGQFIVPLGREFGWSRTALSAGVVLASLTVGLFSPLAGRLTDRYGPRIVATCSMAGLSVGFFGLSHMPGTLASYWGLIALTAVLACGSSPMVFTRIAAGRFQRGRGLAFGIIIAGTGIGGTLLPRLLAPYIAEHGWRAGYLALSIAVLLATPVVALFLRQSTSDDHSAKSEAVQPIAGRSLTEVRREGLFWKIVAMIALAAAGITGVNVHLMPMLIDGGLAPAAAGRAVSLVGTAIIGGRLLTGLLVDRFHASRVAFAIFALAALGCIGMASLGPAAAAIVAVLVGLAMGAEGDLMGYLVAKYFGLREYGAIFGWIYALFLAGAAVGPIASGVIYDHAGNYTFALLLSAAELMAAGFVALLLPAYPDSFRSEADRQKPQQDAA